MTRTFKWRIDRTLPTVPTVAGGSLTWSRTTQTISASASTDAGGSGLRGYQWRRSADAGVHWTLPVLAASVAVSTPGDNIVQFRSIDRAGNVSAWAPLVAAPENTARIDHVVPTTPAVTGGSSTWQNVAQIDISATGSTDSGGSGLAGYEYETSINGGAVWSAPTVGSAFSPTGEGETLVRIHAVDNAGNVSPWATATARIDRTPPGDPTVAGAPSGWSNAASVTLTASSVDGFGQIDHYEYRTRLNGGVVRCCRSPASRWPSRPRVRPTSSSVPSTTSASSPTGRRPPCGSTTRCRPFPR